MTTIRSTETIITGQWVINDGRPVADENCKRISALTKSYLVEVGKDISGWDTLYRDPNDQRLWELIYPESELHGGGPPQLKYISNEEAKNKYGGQKIIGDFKPQP